MASILETLKADVKKIISDDQWTVTDGQKVPVTVDVGLGNVGKKIEATILYADLADSTALVDNHKSILAAEVYKAYLVCAVKIIRNNGGRIASFDGDRVMGVFFGNAKNSSAAKSALQINHAVKKVINPNLLKQYPSKGIQIAAACGVDTSEILVARAGIRDNNDLIWIGRAANYAAKLCSLRQGNYSSWITKDVYNMLNQASKMTNGKNMWEAINWAKYDITVYRSSWDWAP